MEQEERSIAILIDAENITPKYISIILDEANKLGRLSHKRIYGDWTTAKLKKWKEACLTHALTPIQQFTSNAGKNSSDFALVIDAMDILNNGKINGYCIVSSDGDFSRLIVRLKEDNMSMFGMGEEKTPISLVNSYEDFTYLDKMYKLIQADKKEKQEEQRIQESKEPEKTKKVQPKKGKILTSISPEVKIVNYAKILINKEAEEDGWVMWSKVQNLLKRKYPGFSPANYGKNMKMLQYFKQKNEFKTRKEHKVDYIALK